MIILNGYNLSNSFFPKDMLELCSCIFQRLHLQNLSVLSRFHKGLDLKLAKLVLVSYHSSPAILRIYYDIVIKIYKENGYNITNKL